MKKLLTMAAAILLSTGSFAQKNIKSIDIGTSIPMGDNKMKSVVKKEVSLNDVKTEKGLLVMFSCNTCPYVIKSQARTKEMIAHAKESGIGVVIVNSNEAKRSGDDSYKAMSKYAKSEGYDVPYVIDTDSRLADAFGATRTPEVFLFNSTGKLLYKGAMEDNPVNPSESEHVFLKDAINKMMVGETPDPSSTKSIGCTIKRAS